MNSGLSSAQTVIPWLEVTATLFSCASRTGKRNIKFWGPCLLSLRGNLHSNEWCGFCDFVAMQYKPYEAQQTPLSQRHFRAQLLTSFCPAYSNTGLCLRLSAARSDVSNYRSMPSLREGPYEYRTQDLPGIHDPGEALNINMCPNNICQHSGSFHFQSLCVVAFATTRIACLPSWSVPSLDSKAVRTSFGCTRKTTKKQHHETTFAKTSLTTPISFFVLDLTRS